MTEKLKIINYPLATFTGFLQFYFKQNGGKGNGFFHVFQGFVRDPVNINFDFFLIEVTGHFMKNEINCQPKHN